jgi:outer membrane protein OmpA-like peptidoglycan-associated protein/polyisoprenoid-binding protein YceI
MAGAGGVKSQAHDCHIADNNLQAGCRSVRFVQNALLAPEAFHMPELSIPSAGRMLVLAAAFLLSAPTARAQLLPAGPWTLDQNASSLSFQSIKKGSIVETNTFAGFEGVITEDGQAEIQIILESVDTGVDIRNVRMRFLFFETYKYPIATVRAEIAPEDFRDLAAVGRKRIDLAYTLELHGHQKEFVTPVNVTMIDADTVSVASAAPVVVDVKSFGFENGLVKLQEAVGGIDIVPSATVSFDMVFNAAQPAVEVTPVAAVSRAPSGALESVGNLTEEECRNRFEVLSRTEAIYFRVASARLDEASEPLLETVFDIAMRCPSLPILIAGHTDSDGSEDFNQRLSELRARSVVDYLVAKGVPRDRLSEVGYGESQPVVPNDSPSNKSRNRRIEFHLGSG